MANQRAAGVLLLITALATAISVVFRLIANADVLVSEEAVQSIGPYLANDFAKAQSLDAIGSAKITYATGGVARLVAGLTLLASGLLLWRVMSGHHPLAMGAAAVLLAASGIASAVSGGCAVALAALAPSPEPLPASGLLPILASLQLPWDLVGRVEDALFTARWAAGALGFTLAGLGLVALAPVQWRVGGVLRVSALVGVVLGLAMLSIWIDAATVMHRITGVGFLIWLIAAGLWLAAGQVKPPAAPLSH